MFGVESGFPGLRNLVVPVPEQVANVAFMLEVDYAL